MERFENEIAKPNATRQIIVRPEAATEVQMAFDWYEAQSDALGFEFLRAIEACLSGVARNPFAYTVVKVPNIRRARPAFSVCLFYLVDDDAIVVIAVFNVKRQPIDWT